MSDNWISIKDAKPKYSRSKNSLGTPVLVWPRQGLANDGFAYYGKRLSDKPNFYLYGAVLDGITHWQPMPEGPK